MFDPTSYRSVHNLATNTDKRQFEDLIKKTAEAVFMAKVIDVNSFLVLVVTLRLDFIRMVTEVVTLLLTIKPII